jgi:hypothetical protein
VTDPARPSSLSDLHVFDATYFLLSNRSIGERLPFKLLRAIFPQVAATEFDTAIAAALKLDQDCARYFTYTDDYSADVDRAVKLAQISNPGFSPDTYKHAWHKLATAMR